MLKNEKKKPNLHTHTHETYKNDESATKRIEMQGKQIIKSARKRDHRFNLICCVCFFSSLSSSFFPLFHCAVKCKTETYLVFVSNAQCNSISQHLICNCVNALAMCFHLVEITFIILLLLPLQSHFV